MESPTGVTMKLPDKWGSDPLSAYIDSARTNQFATFANKRAIHPLIQIDNCFRTVCEKAINPRPFFPMTFMLRSHSAFLASSAAAMAGQTFETYPLLRSCLECAAYGLFIGDDDRRAEVWLQRHDSSQHRQKVRDEFKFSELKNYILQKSKVLGENFTYLYEIAIDFGGHPNEKGFSGNTLMRKVGGDTHIDAIYLSDDGPRLDAALYYTSQVGIWALHAFQLIYPEKFQILGVRDELESIREQYKSSGTEFMKANAV